jgi:membrane protease YdiL (CAAX protease family)
VFPHAFELHLPGWYHLVTYGALLPLAAIRGWRRTKALNRPGATRPPAPTRLRHFRSTAVMLVLFATLSLLVAHAEWIELFPRPAFSITGVLAGLAMYVVTVLAARPRWRRSVEKRTRIAYYFMPETTAERTWWVGVSVLAGVGEEISWRGVQTALGAALTGSYVAGSVLTAMAFGVGHLNQGWRSAFVIAFFSLGFQAIVAISGSLYIAMAVHVAYDITAGLTYAKLGRELGYRLPEPEVA